ncbi:MAG: Valine--tRNA ligase [Elusimicrobia bacterium ADurb.Bin231]|nr:MAG: Valine--tRNA ligase [Elusimicrobia bacterium ADurb.Bin231]
MEMEKAYSPKDVEEKWLKEWAEKRLFHSMPDKAKKPFTIVIPPPNVTGSLHMGHALNNLLQDILIRYKTMTGYNACWVPGTDHGGIATQNVVEKLLKKEGKRKETLGRNKFIETMWQWRKETGDTILYQLRKLGCSCDWDRTSFTMDEKRCGAVNAAFVEFFNKGYIYRGERIVDWCPRCGTALNESEVEQENEKGHLWHIKYPVVNCPEEDCKNIFENYITVATTRPETMLGDTAVAVNPSDERYKKFIGKYAVLPLVNRIIPIIADEMVDPKFGTGAVKITPAHDRNDAETAIRHNLVFIHVIDKEAKITSHISLDLKRQPIIDKEKGAGHLVLEHLWSKDRYEARKILLDELKNKGFLEKEENYTLPITRCYRCDTATEPLVSRQWFLKMSELSAIAIESAKKRETVFFPESWYKPYILWLENLKDWCISRQIWWGHRIPLWYCMHCAGKDIQAVCCPDKKESIAPDQGKDDFSSSCSGTVDWMLNTMHLTPEYIKQNASITVENMSKDVKGVVASRHEPSKCPHCGKSDFLRDPDVLDTWFSSALWPMSVFGWPENNGDLNYYYPTDVLVTGHEILYLWVARMVMTGLYFKKEVPFKNVYIHGIVRDSHGKKMSKSLGNVIDPLTIMDKYGTDALRFALAYQSIPGRDMQISDENFIMARNFTNKIWNVSRFILMNLDDSDKDFVSKECELENIDKWILSELAAAIESANAAIDSYNPAEAARTLYEFIWAKYCDWYVEFSKVRMYGSDRKQRNTVLKIHLEVLENIIKLLHPIMPFITEEIYGYINKDNPGSILSCEYPRALSVKRNVPNQDTADVEKIIDIISAIRNIRSEMNIKPGETVEVYLRIADSCSEKTISGYAEYIKMLGKAESVKFIKEKDANPAHSASAVVGDAEIFIPLEGKIDFTAEKKRLEIKISKLEQEISGYLKKLENKNFMDKAIPEEVQRVKARYIEACGKKTKYANLIVNIGG